MGIEVYGDCKVATTMVMAMVAMLNFCNTCIDNDDDNKWPWPLN